MPKQNRVTPFGTLIATPARGTLTGNRGCLHDEHQRIRRRFQGRRWIICVLEFKGRKRPIMRPGRYTELFFLDEATALAAGHRPCAECQRERFNLFRKLWSESNWRRRGGAPPGAAALDALLHRERTGTGARREVARSSIGSIPDGVLVADRRQNAYLVLKGRLLLWDPAGYRSVGKRAASRSLRMLTPASVVRTLEAGYPAGIHASASQAIAGRRGSGEPSSPR